MRLAASGHTLGQPLHICPSAPHPGAGDRYTLAAMTGETGETGDTSDTDDSTGTTPWATLEIRLRDAADGDWTAAGERLEALAAMIAEDDRALGVETHDMSTLGQQTLHPELVVYTRPDALEGLSLLAEQLAEQLYLALTL